MKSIFFKLKFCVLECQPQDVSIYVKEGSPPVINPDGATFPKRLFNSSRPDVYYLQVKSDKTPHYVNLTSPIAGTYFAVAFISWTDPTNAAITQQGIFCDLIDPFIVRYKLIRLVFFVVKNALI